MAAEEDVIASFAAPPVVEVVTSVGFSPMSPALFLSLGSFWRDTWQPGFPDLQLQGPYEMPVESFTSGASGNGISLQLHASPPLPRMWATSGDGQQVLQVQMNWFAANWRRHSPTGEATYDRWPSRRASFLKHWTELSDWMQVAGEPSTINQCEVTYINHIRPIEGIWASHQDLSRILPGLELPHRIMGRAEQAAWRSQHIIDPEGVFGAARLHVTVNPAVAGPGPEPSPIYVLELTVRGAPPGNGDLSAFSDRARRIIVETFVSITSADIREAWGQI